MQVRERASSIVATVLSSDDMQTLLLPRLDFQALFSLWQTSTEIRRAIRRACHGFIEVLERAAALYVSPQFAEGLSLISEHGKYISWLIQTPALAIVAPERHEELVGTSYHLLQAHFTRLQKLAVSLSLQRASSKPRNPHQEGARFMLMHLGVRLGMFTESPPALLRLRTEAEAAVAGLTKYHKSKRHQPPATAAAHYTLAGFYTYHHRRSELPNALKEAESHLEIALRIQRRELGELHVSTLCSQLVKAQVMLLQSNMEGCKRLLTEQIALCGKTLCPTHPLAAKMLAVMARLHNKQGDLPQ